VKSFVDEKEKYATVTTILIGTEGSAVEVHVLFSYVYVLFMYKEMKKFSKRRKKKRKQHLK
jgi:hypothetical protein